MIDTIDEPKFKGLTYDQKAVRIQTDKLKRWTNKAIELMEMLKELAAEGDYPREEIINKANDLVKSTEETIIKTRPYYK